MSPDPSRELRRLMRRHRIFFKSSVSGAQVPLVHKETFEDIATLSSYRFDTYCINIDVRLRQEPWRRHTKARVEWLSKRAAQLFEQKRNEAGWRLGLENHVLLRFQSEVVCPTCRARIWRSEIEPSMYGDHDFETNLRLRRQNRETCSCPPDNRPLDIYDTGTNPLFDERAEEIVLQDLSVKSALAEKALDRDRKPDRVYGLRETRNFEAILDQVPSSNSQSGMTVRDSVRVSPFKDADTGETLIFPFLVLEAKSEHNNGFEQIQCQTAFPIQALLQLQDNLQRKAINVSTPGPFLWFLACRGDMWRVYGCYIRYEEPKSLEIVLLWNGSLLSQDQALQLVLIVDYIFDWARDIYRPSILRQLKSFASGKTYDEVSFLHDSDIHSLKRNVTQWMPPPPNNTNHLGPTFDLNAPFDPGLNHQDFLPFPVPKTRYGTIRSANLSTQKFTGLCLSQANVEEFLLIAAGNSIDKTASKSIAREILDCFNSKGRKERHQTDLGFTYSESENDPEKHIFVLSGSDIQVLEESWIGEAETIGDIPELPPAEEFYCLISFECFLSSSWEVVKQITYLAISKSAINILIDWASYTHSSLTPFTPPYCGDTTLQQCINCLSSASPSQSLLAAFTARSLTWYPLPNTQPSSEDTSAKVLDFDSDYGWGQGDVVERYLKLLQRGKEEMLRVQRLPKEYRTEKEEFQNLFNRSDFSFCRISERTFPILNERNHDATTCLRCCQSRASKSTTSKEPWDCKIPHSKNGMVFVGALDVRSTKNEHWHDLCLFALNPVSNSSTISLVYDTIESIMESKQMYHSIKSPKRGHYRHHFPLQDLCVMWNLPIPYRHIFPKLICDIKNWLAELKGEQTIVSTSKDFSPLPLSLLNQFYWRLVEEKLPYNDVCASVYEHRGSKWVRDPLPQRGSVCNQIVDLCSSSQPPESSCGKVLKATKQREVVIISSDSDMANSEENASTR